MLEVHLTLTDADTKTKTKASAQIHSEKTKKYEFFADTNPIFVDFNEKMLVLKTRFFSEDESSKERVVFYKRDADYTGKVFAGIAPVDYYSISLEDSTSEETPATPILVGDDSKERPLELPDYRVKFFKK
jgi:hypothetical protein